MKGRSAPPYPHRHRTIWRQRVPYMPGEEAPFAEASIEFALCACC
jgi:hypothetical protein